MNKNKLVKIIYAAGFLLISFIPVLFFSDKQAVIGNETKAAKPELLAEKGINMDFPSQAEDYFSQNFGFRNKLVYAGNLLKQLVFKTSGQESVIIGEEGWLFYGSALKDYLGTEQLSEIELEKLSVVLTMTSEYVLSQGRDFVFFIAPNKLSVYGEYMPYYYIESSEQGNYERLMDKLDICTVSLKNVLSAAKMKGTLLYHKEDSHWNNYGAAISYEAVMKLLAEEYGEYAYTSYTDKEYRIRSDFSGDLMSMLLPDAENKDEQVYFNVEETYELTSNFKDVDDLLITTENFSALVDKKVTFYRDSFGNALYTFWANDFAAVDIKRELPYNIYQAVKTSDLIAVEIVERNLSNLLTYVPIIPSYNIWEEAVSSMVVNRTTEGLEQPELYVALKENDLYELTGNWEKTKELSEFYILIEKNGENYAYQAIPAGNGWDFTLYLDEENQNVLVQNMENVFLIYEKDGICEKIPVNVTLQD